MSQVFSFERGLEPKKVRTVKKTCRGTFSGGRLKYVR